MEFPIVMIHNNDLELKDPLIVEFINPTTGRCISFAKSKHDWFLHDINIDDFQLYEKAA